MMPMNHPNTLEAALPFTAWSRIFSPLPSDVLREDAWQMLELPLTFEEIKAEYWSTFQVGNPSPRVPLLLHAALGLEAAATREEWLRVINHLELEWDEAHLPPDQLGVACEIYACAIDAEEPVLISELPQRYFLPWCAFAKQELSAIGSPLLFLAEQFETSFY